MRSKCAAGSVSRGDVPAAFVSPSSRETSPRRAARTPSAADAAASCASFAGARRHHTPPSAPSANARAPRVTRSLGAPTPSAFLGVSSPSPRPLPRGGARGYHARTAALTTSTTAIAFSDTDKTHGPRAWSAPNSHFLGTGAVGAGRREPGGALASGMEGRTVASTFASESSPAVAARHTHSRRPGRAPNIQYSLRTRHGVRVARFDFSSSFVSPFASPPSVAEEKSPSVVSVVPASSASSCASVSSGTAARVHACALAPNAPSRGFAPMGVFLNPFARCSRLSCVVVDTSAAPPPKSQNAACTTGASKRTVRAPASGPSRRTTETAPASSPLINASPLPDHAIDVTRAPLCPFGMPATYRPEDDSRASLESGSRNDVTTTSPSSNANATRARRSSRRARVTGLVAEPPAKVSTMNRSRNRAGPSSGACEATGDESCASAFAASGSASASSASPSRARRSKTYTLPMLEPNTRSRGEASTHSSWTRGPVTARIASASARHCESSGGEGRAGQERARRRRRARAVREGPRARSGG